MKPFLSYGYKEQIFYFHLHVLVPSWRKISFVSRAVFLRVFETLWLLNSHFFHTGSLK